jgi:hypothetical protein
MIMTESISFRGRALGLSSDELAGVSNNLGVHAPEIWTVLAVETSGCGFLPDRRPQILYERHIFHRLTGGRFDDGDISDENPGGYGPRGAKQYDRLTEAIAKDRSSALMSASWGVGQVIGENYAIAGFGDVEAMVSAMMQSEGAQLTAMGTFLINSRLNLSLQAHDWTSFARGYNGPNYAINRYDARLNGEYQKCVAGGLPDLNVRLAQLYLTYLGFHPGPVDGIAGEETLTAFSDYADQQGIPDNGLIDSGAVASLVAALPKLS